ncbi:hypothetical protein BV22DRAFT_1125947 [Leucogyrophana mollusca]|uniref:Uncharacterized protein n=1 Tax=Leucogyrophana mollusca TaxID=85980 RepID=A0ACB8BU55_9AGAM|nr:hypothetical protein BV22DRAFT_1125947 [Leucogyrophana mollusca]
MARNTTPNHPRPGPTPRHSTGNVSATPSHGVPSPTPAPRYRHAEPSGPWPWVDFNADLDTVDPGVESSPPTNSDLGSVNIESATSEEIPDERWKEYPQNLFPNWTTEQVKRSKILTSSPDTEDCCTYRVDVLSNGTFKDCPLPKGKHNKEDTWKLVQAKRPEDIRVRVLFVDHLPRSIIQMLGTHYNIEPFFFSSSVNWIPSQYQEDLQPRKGDHITITLPFIRAIRNPISTTETLPVGGPLKSIDTQASLPLSSTDHVLLTDLIAIHMVRSVSSSTILSYHPGVCSERTSARLLHSLILRVSQSVYWDKIFRASNDPTFVLVAILWYALYSWDEAFEKMYEHINWLESRVINTNETYLTRDLHILQAHLLHYTSLLEEFRHSVTFVMDTPNPAMETCQEKERLNSQRLMKRECDNLAFEIARLEGRRKMQSNRLKNAMDLAFAKVNIDESKHMRELTEAAVQDSKHMRKLTEAAVRDSDAMKQISYLTMVFLPASFTAALFGMNVKEIQPGSLETLTNYVGVAIGLTVLTIWLVFAVQVGHPVHENGESSGLFAERLWWPIFLLKRKASKMLKALRMRKGTQAPHDEEKVMLDVQGETPAMTLE